MHPFVKILWLCLLTGFAVSPAGYAQKAREKYTVTIRVTDKETREGMVMANCRLEPLGATAVTDDKGTAVITNVPRGVFTLLVRYVGYEPVRLQLNAAKDLDMAVPLTPVSLRFGEAVVTARRNVAGTATSSTIGRQAIDHLQATSLADVMQLVPGALMGNTDPTVRQNFQLRTLQNNHTAAAGASIVVDGIPMSGNGAMTQGNFSATAFTGTDLRQISADNIESVEIVRGIPSAEYGDLTSGLVVVQSKTGVTPWDLRAKVNPAMMNFSVGKGVRWGNAGIWNFNLDYAQAWGDPRQKTRSFDRYTLGIGWGKDLSRSWHVETKLRYVYAKDWSGNDPDAIDDGTFSKNTSQHFSLSHNGRISLNRLFARTLNYALGVSLSPSDSRNTTFVAAGSGLVPMITAMETGYHAVPWRSSSYLATGISENRPGNFFAKINDTFFFRTGAVHQTFKAGAEYSHDWNGGRGYYNLDESAPLRPNSNGRPRAFSDVPGLHRFSAFVEDRLSWRMNKINTLRLQLGLRYTALQPFGDVSASSLSPRVNASFSVTRWLDLRGGFGWSAKTPGLAYLYPDKHYTDRVAANYLPQNDPAGQLLVYHTHVYEVPYTKGLKNARNKKWEIGADIQLPGGRRLSVLAYHDKTANGFSALTDYYTYTADYFTPGQGLNVVPGAPTTIDYAHPARRDVIFATKGTIGNTDVLVNRGVEFDFDLGEIRPLRTRFFFSGAYQESKSYDTGLNAANPVDLPSSFTAVGTTPVKMVYPSAVDFTRQRRFVNTLRIVTNIPALRMVASFTGQVVWQDYNLSYTGAKSPLGWIDTDLKYHALTPDMAQGFIGADGRYYAVLPAGMQGVSVARQHLAAGKNVPLKVPATWNMSFRLTKEFGNFAGLSFYVNNMLFYEPFLPASTSTTLVQRNTGSFSFGAELFIHL